MSALFEPAPNLIRPVVGMATPSKKGLTPKPFNAVAFQLVFAVMEVVEFKSLKMV